MVARTQGRERHSRAIGATYVVDSTWISSLLVTSNAAPAQPVLTMPPRAEVVIGTTARGSQSPHPGWAQGTPVYFTTKADEETKS